MHITGIPKNALEEQMIHTGRERTIQNIVRPWQVRMRPNEHPAVLLPFLCTIRILVRWYGPETMHVPLLYRLHTVTSPPHMVVALPARCCADSSLENDERLCLGEVKVEWRSLSVFLA